MNSLDSSTVRSSKSLINLMPIRAYAARGLLAVVLLLPVSSHAVQIYDVGAFLNSPTLGVESFGLLDGVFDDFAGTGVDVTFANNLNPESFGILTWQFTNNTAMTLNDVNVFGFLDAEIDPDLNSSFNEFGQLISVTGAGNADSAPDSFEIDEPGFSFGDVFENLFLGALDNTNGVPEGSEDDVSLALGFEIGELFAGDMLTLMLEISPDNIGGLFHGDPDSGTGFFLNGSVDLVRGAPLPVPVSEPSTLLLLLLGLVGLRLGWRGKFNNV